MPGQRRDEQVSYRNVALPHFDETFPSFDETLHWIIRTVSPPNKVECLADCQVGGTDKRRLFVAIGPSSP
jgi:hypothetical protein